MTPSGIEPATFRFVAQYLNHFSVKYRDKITIPPTELASTLLEGQPRRLKRFQPTDLTTRFS
jgi:hypothetical protein